MNFFSDEQASELRELFFESAAELVQTLNETALELEQKPADAEVIRTMRRAVHTLKGDSAACGFRELSELAHEFEDVLTPEIAARTDASVAQIALNAADVFEAMLAACRDKLQPPDTTHFREVIRGIAQAPAAAAIAPASSFEPRFAWSEYDHMVIPEGAKGALFNVGIRIDARNNPFCAASLQLVRNVLHEAGTVLAMFPAEGSTDAAESIEAVIATEHDQHWLERKCRIPAVVTDLVVLPYTENAEPTPAEPSKAAPQEPPAASAPPQDAHSHPENILRVDAGRVDAVLNLVGELIISKSMFHQAILEFSRRFPKDPLRGRFADVMANQTRVLNDLQRSVMKIRMVPVEQLFRRFPRVIRDVSKMTGKDVRLMLRGENTDLDKSILDSLAEPLTHLVRNGVDHGIEPPEARVAAGKPAQGTILLNAYHQANHVVVEIGDDGRGIDTRHIAEEALAKGIVAKEQLDIMDEPDILQLIFEPGFSTAEKITEVSGRGVGLDVVKTVLEQMKGTVSVHTRPGEGTTFQLRVPLTLAIIKALLFRVGERAYAVPLGNVLEITRANAADIHRVDNHEVLQLREEVLTLVPLDHLVDKRAARVRAKTFIVVVALAGRKFGLMVDQLLGEEELVIKPLDSDLVSSDLVSGASIMGDGSVVLVINVPGVVEKSGKSRSTYVRADSAKKRVGRNMGAEA